MRQAHLCMSASAVGNLTLVCAGGLGGNRDAERTDRCRPWPVYQDVWEENLLSPGISLGQVLAGLTSLSFHVFF